MNKQAKFSVTVYFECRKNISSLFVKVIIAPEIKIQISKEKYFESSLCLIRKKQKE